MLRYLRACARREAASAPVGRAFKDLRPPARTCVQRSVTGLAAQWARADSRSGAALSSTTPDRALALVALLAISPCRASRRPPAASAPSPLAGGL